MPIHFESDSQDDDALVEGKKTRHPEEPAKRASRRTLGADPAFPGSPALWRRSGRPTIIDPKALPRAGCGGETMKFLSDDQIRELLPAETSSFPSPVPTQIVSSDEYLPFPQTPQ